jgi:hypothetical protein
MAPGSRKRPIFCRQSIVRARRNLAQTASAIVRLVMPACGWPPGPMGSRHAPPRPLGRSNHPRPTSQQVAQSHAATPARRRPILSRDGTTHTWFCRRRICAKLFPGRHGPRRATECNCSHPCNAVHFIDIPFGFPNHARCPLAMPAEQGQFRPVACCPGYAFDHLNGGRRFLWRDSPGLPRGGERGRGCHRWDAAAWDAQASTALLARPTAARAPRMPLALQARTAQPAL